MNPRDGSGKKATPGPINRFMPIDWKFIKDSPPYARSSCASSSPPPRFFIGSSLPSSTLHSYCNSPEPSPRFSLFSKKLTFHTHLARIQKVGPKKRDGCEAAEAEYRRRLSNARNLYDRLHLGGGQKETGVKFEENQRRLGRLEVTALYRKHLEKRNLRIPVAIRGVEISNAEK